MIAYLSFLGSVIPFFEAVEQVIELLRHHRQVNRRRKCCLRNTQPNAKTGGLLSFESQKDDPPESFRDTCPIPTVKKTDVMA